MPDGETLVGAKPKGQREYNKGGNTTSCVGNLREGDLFYPLARLLICVCHTRHYGRNRAPPIVLVKDGV